MKSVTLRATVYVLFVVFFLTVATFLTLYQASEAAAPQSAQGGLVAAEPTATPMFLRPPKPITPTATFSATLLPQSTAGPLAGIEATITVMRYELDCFDLETGAVIPTDDSSAEIEGECPEHGDFQIAYNADRTPHAVLFQNECVGTGCQKGTDIALSAKAFQNVVDGDRAVLTFTRGLVDVPFTAVTILRTAGGNHYKIELVEDEVACDGGGCISFRWQILPPN